MKHWFNQKGARFPFTGSPDYPSSCGENSPKIPSNMIKSRSRISALEHSYFIKSRVPPRVRPPSKNLYASFFHKYF